MRNTGSYNPTTGGAGQGIGQFIGSLFGQSPQDAFSQAASAIPKDLEKYLGPYSQMGQDMLPQLQQLFGGLSTDPQGLYNKIAGGYTQSPGYQNQLHQALTAANNAASAGGMAGTPLAQQNAAQSAQNVSSEDFNNYMRSVLGLQGQGLSGLSNLENIGFQGSQGMAKEMTSYDLAQAMMNASGAQNQKDQFGKLGGAVGSLAGFI